CAKDGGHSGYSRYYGLDSW
nr:immunoglobulin heavy chain junction region [Macaca mulatta]MOV42097.1 immunoglobulin heavy chain junction region [Macaca mulatta]MOV43105.1 immunoglobulin heavy chain junction region [Macaca mulatta]MOV46305.1 immunoglobulin heavy chain junction region [Macaca mulatta]